MHAGGRTDRLETVLILIKKHAQEKYEHYPLTYRIDIYLAIMMPVMHNVFAYIILGCAVYICRLIACSCL